MFAEIDPRGSSNSTSMRESVRVDSACAAYRVAPIRATDALAMALSRRNWRRFMVLHLFGGKGSSFQIDRLLQRQIARGASHEERVVSGQQLPGVLVDVEDGEIPRINLDRHFLTLARIEFDLTPPHQTLGWLSCTGRQDRVYLCNLRARPGARIRQPETQAETLPGSQLEIGIVVGRVGKPITKGEQYFFPFRVIPLVTNLESFVISDLKWWQALGDGLPRFNIRGAGGRLLRRFHQGGMRQVRVAPG